MDTEILQHIGHSLYNTKRLKEWKRYVVFRSRCMLHSEQIGGLLDFFAATPLRRDMLRHTTSFVEQATRQFFYKNSTYDERISLVKAHVEFLESKLTEDALRRLYADGEMLRLWEDSYEEKPLTLELWFHAGQRKEGCLSLDGVRPCTRYKEIEVDFLDADFKKQHGKYSGWTAQIIQHEIDHCNGVVI